MLKSICTICAFYTLLFTQFLRAAPPTVSMGTTNLVYTTDDMNNKILDFSYAGYMEGGVTLPTLPNKVILSPIAGDNTAAIQAAIATVSALTPDVHGFRGAVYLNAGNYEVDGTLNITTSGVVLRGAGQSTILTFPGTDRQVINIQGATGIAGTGTTYLITDTYVPVGATSFNINSSTSNLAVGNLISLHRPWTQPWIDAMTMTAYWATKNGPGFERTITAINGTTITVDTQLPTPFELTYLTGSVQKATDTGRISQCGVENMALVSTFTPPNDIADAAVQFNNCKNCWAKNLSCNNFGNGYVVNGAKYVTVQDCTYVNGYNNGSARPFAFDCNGQYVLFQRCVGVSGFAHVVATQDSTPGPNVFLNITAEGSDNFDGGPHQRWGMSELFDNVGGTISELKIYNAAAEGSGHGWVCGHSILYNCTPLTVICQMPTLAYNYNYLMGGTGTVESTTAQGQNGVYVSPGTILKPQSLYLQQLKERLGTSALQNIGYPRFTGNQKILAHSSLLYLAVQNANPADNTPVVQNTFTNAAGQQWQFVDLGTGYYEIKNTTTGKALSILANSTAHGALAVDNTYTTAGTSAQWQILDTTGGLSKIINRASGLALEITGNSLGSGVQLDQNPYTGASNQQFQILTP